MKISVFTIEQVIEKNDGERFFHRMVFLDKNTECFYCSRWVLVPSLNVLRVICRVMFTSDMKRSFVRVEQF